MEVSMNLKRIFVVIFLALNGFFVNAAVDSIQSEVGEIKFIPIEHASFIIKFTNIVVYVDPVGNSARYTNQGRPDVIFYTHGHGDHFDVKSLNEVCAENTKIIAPPSVAQLIPPKFEKKIIVLENGGHTNILTINVWAIPMYNLTPDRLNYHKKGVGNGYVLTIGGKKIYISGDTEDIPEMRSLKDIDVAFVCMNLPYTMNVEQAADAVKAFKPKIVYPYHCRGSDLDKFSRLVEASGGIEVRRLNWYPGR